MQLGCAALTARCLLLLDPAQAMPLQPHRMTQMQLLLRQLHQRMLGQPSMIR